MFRPGWWIPIADSPAGFVGAFPPRPFKPSGMFVAPADSFADFPPLRIFFRWWGVVGRSRGSGRDIRVLRGRPAQAWGPCRARRPCCEGPCRHVVGPVGLHGVWRRRAPPSFHASAARAATATSSVDDPSTSWWWRPLRLRLPPPRLFVIAIAFAGLSSRRGRPRPRRDQRSRR